MKTAKEGKTGPYAYGSVYASSFILFSSLTAVSGHFSETV